MIFESKIESDNVAICEYGIERCDFLLDKCRDPVACSGLRRGCEFMALDVWLFLRAEPFILQRNRVEHMDIRASKRRVNDLEQGQHVKYAYRRAGGAIKL